MTPEICVALDGMSLDQAVELADRLQGRVWGFKVGDLLTEHGSSTVISNLRDYGKVFADLKFFDIPSTVYNHCLKAAKHGADIVTVHASGGVEMMKEAVRAVGGIHQKCQVAAVTVLTSFTDDNIWHTYRERCRADAFAKLMNNVFESGVHAIVCGAGDLDKVGRLHGYFTIVPGIRPTNYQVRGDDQQVKATKAPAYADLLVVGRPITQAGDPEVALERLMEEIYGKAR